MGKSNFLVENAWGDMFLSLSDENAGQLIKAMYSYQRGEEPSVEDPVLSAVFNMVKATMDANDEAYEKECEKRREAVRKRWNKNKEENTNESNSIQVNTSVYTCIQENSDTDMNQDQSQYHNNLDLDKDNSEVETVIKHLNTVCNKSYRVNSKSAKYIKARLSEGFTVDDCKAVVDKKARDWIGTEWAKYLRPSTLFAPTKFEEYLNQEGKQEVDWSTL